MENNTFLSLYNESDYAHLFEALWNLSKYHNLFPNLLQPYQPYPDLSCDALCVFIVVSCIIIFVLGVLGNGLVIWIIALETKRSVNSSWYLSLAVSDLLLCITLPFTCVFWMTGQWHFGPCMCKFINLAIPLNMYSSVFLLVVISVDRCICVIAPVWAQNHRTLRGSSVTIVAAWILSAALSFHNLIWYTTEKRGKTTLCGYLSTKETASVLVVIGFVFELALPFGVIVVCYAVIMQKLRANRMSRSIKPFTLMTAVIITFLICWLPFQIFRILGISNPNLKTETRISIILAYANSFMNPVLYSFMGHDFRNRCIKSICARMENALQEDGQTTKAVPGSANSQNISI